MLFEAVADYTNPHLLEETCAAGKLRRLECAWAIEQAITTTYQLQNEFVAVSDRLLDLQDKIRRGTITVIDTCDSEEKLDFLFPEISRIHNQDLAVLNFWQNHINWMRSLSSSELSLLQDADLNESEIINLEEHQTATALTFPVEQLLYEELKPKSHFLSLRDQLSFMMQPDLRAESELYISQHATATGYKTLFPSILKQASDCTIANLYWYFQVRHESATQN